MGDPRRVLENIKSTKNNMIASTTAGDWWKLLRANKFAVSPIYWRRLLHVSYLSTLSALGRWNEERLFAEKVAETTIEEDPVFVLGHYRSGTTHLHNLLSKDTQFAFPNIFQIANPHLFLTSEQHAHKYEDKMDKKRPMDNVIVDFQAPGEDEFAIMHKCQKSMCLGWIFPKHMDHYMKYLTFKGLEEAEVQEFKDAMIWFFKKLTLKYNKRLLLKSPTHTAKVGIIRDLFPAAKFINIHRNPYDVFQSMLRTYLSSNSYSHLQRPDLEAFDDEIILAYKLMYEAYFEDRKAVPVGHLHEFGYAELTADPVGTIKKAYERLNLSGFEDYQPKLEEYLGTIKSYKRSKRKALPAETVEKINEEWKFVFDAFGYEQINPA